MKIGIVLSTTPGYSETFFMSKIKGLQDAGYTITLFAQKANPDFTLCKVVVAPKVYKKNPVLQFIKMIWVLLVFALTNSKRFFKFIKLEQQINRAWLQIVKRRSILRTEGIVSLLQIISIATLGKVFVVLVPSSAGKSSNL